jgi:hypothetical protein
MSDKVTDPEPGPLDSCGPDIVDLVKADLDERRRVGIETYGKPLRAHNGRRPLRDLYAEMLDGIQYLRQELQEREALIDRVAALELDHPESMGRYGDGWTHGVLDALQALKGES